MVQIYQPQGALLCVGKDRHKGDILREFIEFTGNIKATNNIANSIQNIKKQQETVVRTPKAAFVVRKNDNRFLQFQFLNVILISK